MSESEIIELGVTLLLAFAVFIIRELYLDWREEKRIEKESLGND